MDLHKFTCFFFNRHNLKRKLANLAPITVEEFEQRMQTYIGGPAEKNKKKEHLGTKAKEKAEKRAAKMQERNEVCKRRYFFATGPCMQHRSC